MRGQRVRERCKGEVVSGCLVGNGDEVKSFPSYACLLSTVPYRLSAHAVTLAFDYGGRHSRIGRTWYSDIRSNNAERESMPHSGLGSARRANSYRDLTSWNSAPRPVHKSCPSPTMYTECIYCISSLRPERFPRLVVATEYINHCLAGHSEEKFEGSA